jgi:hypothetical protein
MLLKLERPQSVFASSLEAVRGDAVRVPPEVAGVASVGVVVAFVALVDTLMLVHSLASTTPAAGCCCLWHALVVLTTFVVLVVPSVAGTKPV